MTSRDASRVHSADAEPAAAEDLTVGTSTSYSIMYLEYTSDSY